MLAWALAVAGPIAADAVYKSVDADGRVTYSAAPPPAGGARTVEELRLETGPGVATAQTKAPPPAPAPEPVASQDPTQVRQAQQAVIQAKAELEQAKIHGAEDWQTSPGGERVSTPDYERRVTAGQEKVRAAEAALERARRP